MPYLNKIRTIRCGENASIPEKGSKKLEMVPSPLENYAKNATASTYGHIKQIQCYCDQKRYM